MNILQLDAGLFAEQSVTRQLTANIVANLQRRHPDAKVVQRDLIAQAPEHLSGEMLMAAGMDAEQRSEAQQQALALTEQLLEELFAADIIVVGAPMYNFTIPTQLKAWFDRVLQAGTTFKYTEQGPVGLLRNKKVIVASGRGGIYSEGPAAALDHQESYVKAAFNFIGLDDIEIIRAEGVNLSPENKERALASAKAEIEQSLTA
ncbi:FMN-dependent NADH-azoreductase [Idiomarina tyrosinivorans]|uniref:FMN dependent NADH:quinone oxidoreductase n=1 Tax=Idiomarina tyrosinivorans TaxID=1445662 RepID=A0A432ZLE3_9GAMM|nr:NAD(P)H-dependent oxidoreductase [Idiomarina tyrosinivorans]RUO78845.1 FMN-dependent NADH-azoreductase [Idiomarina tyrosinivorans]